MKKKNQTVIATEENVIDFIKSDVYLFVDTLRQLGSDKKFEHEHSMVMLDAKFGDTISEELMVKVSKALEEHGIVDTEKEEQDMEEQDTEQTVKDEELKAAEWEYFEDETGDSPYAEATATIDGKEVTVGYLWDEQEGGCYVRIDGADVEDRGFCDHCCEVVQKAIGKELTGLSYELWESWVEYHGLHEGWEDMDEDERYELYNKAIVCC